MRDAWQVQSRPHIIEEYINGKETPMSEMGSKLWTSKLTEALACLNENKQYRGKGKQEVTLANPPKNGEITRTMWVTPHLHISTPIDTSNNVIGNLEAGISRLKPVYTWVAKGAAS